MGMLLVSAVEADTPRDEFGNKLIEWIDPLQWASSESKGGDIPNRKDESETEEVLIVPLYPLSAIAYLPDTTSNCTLSNTERRNIQMALDLESSSYIAGDADPRSGDLFCAVLRAVDTGAVSKVATLLRVIQYHKERKVHPTSDDSLVNEKDESEQAYQRIRLTCVPTGETVDILNIENAHASSLEFKVRHPTEYLRATVRRRRGGDHCINAFTAQSIDPLYQKIQEDYHAVRTLYLEGIGTADMPPFSFKKLSESLPTRLFCERSSNNNDDEEKYFWRGTTVWQSLCETVREGIQLVTTAHRNELLIEAAIRQGGPLQLPIHIADLKPTDRQRIEKIEQDVQNAWRNEIKLEPCLDFQVLLSLSTLKSRLEYFSNMVERECTRLTKLRDGAVSARSISNRLPIGTSSTEQLTIERKGAWFNDTLW